MKLSIATYNIHKGVSWFAQKPRIHDMRDALQVWMQTYFFYKKSRDNMIGVRSSMRIGPSKDNMIIWLETNMRLCMA